ncbi:MAG: cell division protein FtsL [Candidatus Sumerlaeia bacterium]|nr:cell division protein FtsL [Candidatus Sumerlaeia bacterium]
MKHIFSSFIFRVLPFGTFFLAALLLSGWLYINREKLAELWQAYERRNSELARVEKLEHQRQQLEENWRLMEQTSLETERLVREKFKMKRPEEKIIILK